MTRCPRGWRPLLELAPMKFEAPRKFPSRMLVTIAPWCDSRVVGRLRTGGRLGDGYGCSHQVGVHVSAEHAACGCAAAMDAHTAHCSPLSSTTIHTCTWHRTDEQCVYSTWSVACVRSPTQERAQAYGITARIAGKGCAMVSGHSYDAPPLGQRGRGLARPLGSGAVGARRPSRRPPTSLFAFLAAS